MLTRLAHAHTLTSRSPLRTAGGLLDKLCVRSGAASEDRGAELARRRGVEKYLAISVGEHGALLAFSQQLRVPVNEIRRLVWACLSQADRVETLRGWMRTDEVGGEAALLLSSLMGDREQLVELARRTMGASAEQVECLRALVAIGEADVMGLQDAEGALQAV